MRAGVKGRLLLLLLLLLLSSMMRVSRILAIWSATHMLSLALPLSLAPTITFSLEPLNLPFAF